MLSQQHPLGSANTLSHNTKSTAQRTLEYRFVSGLDNSYSKSARAHVLQRHLRQRRLRAGKRERSKGKLEDDDDLALVRQGAEHTKRSNAVKSPAVPGRICAATDPGVTSNATSLGRCVDPKSLLGQGTVDPFLTSACRTTTTQNLLIEYCG